LIFIPFLRNHSLLLLAEEPEYEDEGPRRQKPAEKSKRLSQSKLDVISENQSSEFNTHVNIHNA
jgi:hypothetical protein